MRLILVRHGETAWNDAGRYQGWTDTDLSARGRATSRKIGTALARAGVTRFDLWTSDLRRAVRTARLAFGRRPRIDRRLRELDFGVFTGRTYEENLERFGDRFVAWVEHRHGPVPPGQETLEDFLARTAGWLEELRRDATADRTVVAVTHGGVVRALVRPYLDGQHQPRNGEITVLRWDAGALRPSVERLLPNEGRG